MEYSGLIDALERYWNKSLSPKWLNDFLEMIAEHYKDTRVELKTVEKQDLSEYNQQMFYHHYEIANRMKDCKLDLDRAQKFLNCCLKDYENIPEDDRDNSLDDLSDYVKELLQEVRTEIDRLSTSLPDCNHKEFVETCLALGNIDNNSEMQSHLAECSQVDKKLLGQLLWCTQLVRFIMSLEEFALFQTFQRVAIPAENETYLARAYHLAMYGGPMKNSSKNTKQKQKVEESVLYGSVKQYVRNMIESEVTMNKLNLEQVKHFIAKEIGKELSGTDAAFIEDEYKEICLDQCLEVINNSMKGCLRSSREINITKVLNMMEHMTTCNDFPDYFKSLDYLKELPKMSLNENEERRIVQHFKKVCLEHINDYCKTVKSEFGLLKCLNNYLSQTRHIKKVVDRLSLNENTSEIDFRNVLNLTDQENNEQLSELKCMINDMQIGNKLIIEDKLAEAIRSFVEPVQIHSVIVDGREVVEVIGKHVVWSKELETVENYLANDCEISEVRIIGVEVFHIDADLVNDIWHGKNIAVRSKLIVVHGTVVWDVSGKSNRRKYSPAHSASAAGGNGWPGQDGHPGESGGNVLILTEQMRNCEQFTIRSDGGNGSDGQDGGNGCKGRDGIGITRQDLERSFKSPVRFLATSGMRYAEARRLMTSIGRNFTTFSKRDVRSSEIFTEASAQEGQRIVFSYCEPKIFKNYSHCYLLYKGSLGKPGGQGGDFGRGGEAGFPGQISVKSIVTGEMFNFKKSSVRGQDGRPGVPGLYGNTGCNGWDMGYLDYQFWSSPVYYGEDLQSKFTVTYHDDSKSNSVWCWYKYKYASITTASAENNFQNRHQKRQFEQRDRYQSASAVTKKAIIESSFIASYDQHFNTVEGNVLYDMYIRIERIQQRAMEGSAEQQKKSNEKQKIHHIVSCQTIEQDIDEPLATMPNTAKRRALKSTRNLEFKVDSMVNWRQLKHCQMKKSDLIAKFNLLDSTNMSKKDLRNIKQNLIDKYKLLIFEELSERIYSGNNYSDKALLASKFTSICLEEDTQQSGITCHDELGTLDEYLYQFSGDKQKEKLKKYCYLTGKHLPPSVVQGFLLEEELTEEENSSAQAYLDHYKLFSELQDYDSTISLDQFMKELIRSTHAKVLSLWENAHERCTLVPNLIHEIDRDYRLGMLHARYVNYLNKKFSWEQCLQDDKFLETFRTLIVKRGPLTRCYRELLAYVFGVNIQIYAWDCQGKLSLQDSHNAEANEIVYLLLQNKTFIKLTLNENLMKLEDVRRSRARKCLEISAILMQLAEKRSIDDFIANYECINWGALVSNDKDDFDNADLSDQLLKYFTFGERHSLGMWLNRSDVSSSVYSKLLRNILFRFDAEGNHISTDEFRYLVNQYLVASNIGVHEETLIGWVILAYPQDNWIGEVLLLHLEKYFKKPLENMSKWRQYLAKVENKSLLILLSAKLDMNKHRQMLTIDKMDGILRLLYLSTANPETLQTLDLSEWYYILEEIYWTEKLQKTAHWETDCQKFKEASYYTVSLLNSYGFEMLEQFFNKLAQNEVKHTDIVDALWNIYNGRCLLTDESLVRLAMVGVQDWIKETKSHVMDYNERGAAILVKLIKDNNNASRNILQKLDNIKKDIQKINKERGIMKNILQKEPSDMLKTVKRKIFKSKIPTTNSFSNKSTVEKLKDIDDAINEAFNFRLRNAQKLTILTLLENDKNTLAQVATGEGKSLIVVTVAIIKASLGQKVDIITSSSVLARRDAEQSKAIYAKFGVNVSHNCSEDIEKRKEAYSENQVVYGDLSSFQRDYLLHKFYQKNVLGDRNFVNVIVDEVDSMLLDRGNNMLYLAHDLPDMDKLESVYVFIWQWVNNSSKKLDNAVIREAVLWQMYGVIKPDDVGKLDATLGEEQRNCIWHNLVKTKVIDDEGKLVAETVNKDVLADVLGSNFSVYLDRLEYLLSECINREKCIYVPNYLRSFVDLHLNSWIDAAKMALVMEAGQDYVVDVDRSGSSADRTPNITIIDRDTGTDMVNSQWEAALHQFVQLKHGCKTYLQSLKAVFISNVKYFKMYKNLYGLSGTLGSHRERDLLEEIYGVDFINIPTAKLKLFHEDAPIVCQNVADWTNAIIKSTRNKTDRKQKPLKEAANPNYVIRQRSVLIICETLNEVTSLYKAFDRAVGTSNVRTYTREYEEFDVGELPEGQIIIATNLAGRGTDIKITPELKKAGGMHVCLTYLPTNIRVEQQAFGRAARCGDRGSGQLILLDPNEARNILQLKRERDTRELSRISQIKKHYETRVVHEENCFSKFTEQYDELRKLLTKSNVTKRVEDVREILLSSALDRWVFWLDENEKNLIANAKANSHTMLNRSLDAFLGHLKSLKANSYESLLEWVNPSVPRMVKLGRFLVLNQQRDLAHKLFERIIAREPHFSEAAHYYNAYALSTEMTFCDGKEVEKFSLALRSAANLFEERIQNLTSHVSLIDRIKANFKENILPITAYKEQKQTVCKLYDMLSKSVDDILGHPVSATSFVCQDQDEDIISKSMSVEIFNALLANQILQKPTLKDTICEEELRGLSFSYGTSAAKLKQFLDDCRTNQGRYVKFEQFVRLLKDQVQLPSREGFWRYLIEQSILTDEEKYVVVDRTKLSYNDMQFLDARVSKIKLDVRPTVCDGELLLYPDQLLDGYVYPKNAFKDKFGPDKYATFKATGAISFQRKAKFDLEKIEKFEEEKVSFHRYDSVSLEDFAMLNISENDARNILDLLVQGKVLKRQKINEEVYDLVISNTNIKSIKLGPYKIYEEVVRDLLNLCFCYRIAFQSIKSCSEGKRFQDITLISIPHRRIAADLFCARIIEPAKVADSAAEVDDLAVYGALSRLNLNESCIVKVVQQLKSLKGRLHYLKMVPFPEHDRYTNVEEWNLFALNGNELLLKLKGVSIFKIALTFIWGAIQIGLFMLNNFKKLKNMQAIRSIDFSSYTAGWGSICSAFKMAFDAYVTDHNKHKFNNFLKRVALIEAKYLGVFRTSARRFAFEVSQPATRDIQHVRKLAVSLIRGFDTATNSASVKLLIEERLQQLCTNLCNGLLSTVDKSEAVAGFGECLKKVVGSMGLDNTKTKLAFTIEAHLKRKQYFDNMQSICGKSVETILHVISKATRYSNIHRSIATIISGEISEATITALKVSEPNIASIVNEIVLHLSGKLELMINQESDAVQMLPTDSEPFIEEAINDLKKQLREKLNDLLQQTILIPVLDRGSHLLLNYAERQTELQYSTEDSSRPGEEFAKKVRVDQIKTECEEKRRAQAMRPIENLLDQQFNEALANWKRQTPKLQRLAVQIRRGEPVDDQYLEPCLDAVRFVLLRRAVVLSNVSVNLVTENGTSKIISSPRSFNGIAVDLHLKKNKFHVGLTQNKTSPINNCLYDCLRQIIFELKSITSKQFAREISRHLINLSENTATSSSNSENFLNFNHPSTFKELCFAQYLRACFERPSDGGHLYGDLMERAKNGKNRARDWHGTEHGGHVEVVTLYGSEQFVEAGFRKSATTDTNAGKIMSDLREAFYKIFSSQVKNS